MRRVAPLIIVVAALFGLIRLFRYAQRYDPALERAAAGAPPEVSIQLENAILLSRTRGVMDWSVHSDRIDVKRPDYGGLDNYSGIDFAGIKGGKLYRDGKLAATYSARSARYDQPTAAFNIEGPLRLISTDGDRLESDKCVWMERGDEVRLTQGAKAVVQGHTLKSPFVLFSPKKRIVSCPQGAEALFDDQTVRASNLVWDVRHGAVVCRGPVSGERKNMTFSAQEAKVYLAEEKGSKGKRTHVRHLRANNGVVQLRIEGEDIDAEVVR